VAASSKLIHACGDLVLFSFNIDVFMVDFINNLTYKYCTMYSQATIKKRFDLRHQQMGNWSCTNLWDRVL